MVSELIQKYIWLIQTILRRSNKGISIDEIQRAWKNRWTTTYSRKSFINHKKAICEIFDIEIQCNRRNNKYYIADADNVSNEQKESAWLINSFTIGSLLSMSKEKLKGRIAIENIPSGQKYLTSIMDAMLENYCLLIDYQKYTSTNIESLNVRPYALKEFEKRWYLLAFCEERNDMRIYSLDRIMNISVLEKQFNIEKDFDIESYFKDSFGIYQLEKDKVIDIYIATTELEAKYLRDLPLHNSQREILDIDDNLKQKMSGLTNVFHLHLAPNENFKMELCKHCNKIKVLEPEELAEDIKNRISETLKLYNN